MADGGNGSAGGPVSLCRPFRHAGYPEIGRQSLRHTNNSLQTLVQI
jgi:hypothetical protein